MKKYIKITAVAISLIFVFTGCSEDSIVNGNEITSEITHTLCSGIEAVESDIEISEYISDDGVNSLIYGYGAGDVYIEKDNGIFKGTYFGTYDSIEEVKSVEEEKSILKEKEEFLQFFESFSGFSLPDYFIFPKVTRETNWNQVIIYDDEMCITIHFVAEKRDALEMLEHLINDYSWSANARDHRPLITLQERKENAYCFSKKRQGYERGWKDSIGMYFNYNKENDCYIIELSASFTRVPKHLRGDADQSKSQ